MSLLAEYKASLKNITIEEYVDLVLFRPLAFLFVKSIYWTNITPNQITCLSMITGIGAGDGTSAADRQREAVADGERTRARRERKAVQ